MKQSNGLGDLFHLLWSLVLFGVFMVAYFRDWRLEQLIFWGVLAILADHSAQRVLARR